MVAEAQATKATVYIFDASTGKICDTIPKRGELPIQKRSWPVHTNGDIGLQILENYDRFCRNTSQAR